MTSQMSAVERLDDLSTRLRSALLSDVLDSLGNREHILPSGITSLEPDTVLVGFAVPVLVEEVFDIPQEPYRGEIASLDDLRVGEVPVLAAAGTTRAALWGELFSTAARARGGRGVVVDGPVRDSRLIRTMGFPVFCRGTLPLDCNGRTRYILHRQTVRIGRVPVADGDLLFADEDGIVVVPQTLATQSIELALEKAATENQVRAALLSGMTLSAAWDRFRVL
jgi:4-hydroxy-4-methyl-2-oxoglutarate aldolase